MNTQNMTQKSIEALQSAANLAKEYGNREIGQEHILYALLSQDGGLIPELMKRTGVSAEKVKEDA